MLVACHTTTAVTPPTCLPLVTYSAEQDAKLAEEVAGLESSDIIITYLTDYGAMRAADRACIATAKGGR